MSNRKPKNFGSNINQYFFDGIKAWTELTESDSSQGYLVVYGGNKELHQWHSDHVTGCEK